MVGRAEQTPLRECNGLARVGHGGCDEGLPVVASIACCPLRDRSRTNFGALQHAANGDNAPMSINALLVHGAGGGAWEWNAWARVLRAHGARLLAPELVPAVAGLRTTRLADYSAQLREAAGTLPTPRVLVGASLGGLLAMQLADELAASALVLVNPLLPGTVAARDDVVDGIVPWSRTSLARTRRALPDADDATVLYAATRWRDESAAVLADARAATLPARPACRVLVLASKRDHDVPPEATRGFAHAWRADFVLLPGASHVGPLLGRDAARVAELAATWSMSRA